MHAARIDRSERLARVHAVLSDGLDHSTLDIVNATPASAPSIPASPSCAPTAPRSPCRQSGGPGRRANLALPHDRPGRRRQLMTRPRFNPIGSATVIGATAGSDRHSPINSAAIGQLDGSPPRLSGRALT